MKNEKLYVITEGVYHQHIDNEVHLYGLLRQLAFLAETIKEHEDVENFKETALHFGRLADEVLDNSNIPGRYLAYGNKDDLITLKEKELEEVTLSPEDETAPQSLREVLEDYLLELMDTTEILAAAIGELDAIGVE